MTLLGFMHERGLGGLRNMDKALEWYRAAAREEEPDALMALAQFGLENAHGITAADARGFLARALEAGRAEAALDLARLYLEGVGGPPDEDEALRILALTADGGGGEAAYQAGVILSDRDGAAAQAARLFLQAAENGHAQAATLYGHALYDGIGVEADKPEAAAWYARAADRGDAEGMVYHALVLALAEGELSEAAYWLARSRLAEGERDATDRYGPVRERLEAGLTAELGGAGMAEAESRARAAAGG